MRPVYVVKLYCLQMRFDRNRLREFVDRALVANITYLAVRRELYGLFTLALDRNGDVEISSREFITIRTFLSSRDPRPKDEARLAYEVALVDVHSLVDALALA